ncbi:MAG: hypothetical protein HYT72_00210 [Candidatus Aenigmarchaeota archaeon]|nr:hypothetical protein [Candidatus Aenigmarchaeota archaeon]
MVKNKIIIERKVFWMSIVYLIGITLAYNLWRNNLLVVSILALLWAINIKYWHTRSDNTLFVLAFFGGSLAEINAIQLGIWSYANPSFLGIPLWLPLVWGETAVVGKRFADVLNQLY